MIRTASIRHGKDGYSLYVEDVPEWAYAADAISEAVVTGACRVTNGWACPLCVSNRARWLFKIGWGTDPDPDWEGPAHSLGGLLFALGQLGGNLSYKRSRTVYTRLLAFQEVCDHFPDSRIEWDDDGVDFVRGVLIHRDA